jgi:demethylmenaquinone methyltransferase/2-methoxy-6-polyprenyl-1,4-benzoquinol methylase/phosphoethanolamine N-methyltransferase
VEKEDAMTHAEHAPETHGHTIRWWAPLYDAATWLISFGGVTELRKTTVRVAQLQAGEAVLDVGCGTGDLTLRAARRVGVEGRAVGIDASPEMIAVSRRKAAKKGAKVDFRVAPIEALPFDDGEFDVVLSSYMLHHLPDDLKDQGLAEVRRVLKPGGRFVAVDLRPGKGAMGALAGLMGHRLPDDYGDQLMAKMRAAGFAGVEEVATKQKSSLFLRGTVGAKVSV